MDKTFNSATFGQLNFGQVVEKTGEYVDTVPEFNYRLIIGTDSQSKNGGADFVTAVIIHRIGAGAIYFWQRTIRHKPYVLRQRIYEEALLSLEVAHHFVQRLGNKNGLLDTLEIHVDVGQVGPTREIIAEVVGMVRGSGFNVKIKPEAYGAAKVADRHT